YLAGWNGMQHLVNDERSLTRHLLHISQEIVGLKNKLTYEIDSVGQKFQNCDQLDNQIYLKEFCNFIEFQVNSVEHDISKSIPGYHNDINQGENNLNEFRKNHPEFNVGNLNDKILLSKQLLDQLSDKTESYRTLLKTILIIVNNFHQLESNIEQKFTDTFQQLNHNNEQPQIYLNNSETSSSSSSSSIGHNNNRQKVKKNLKELNQLIYKYNQLIKQIDFSASDYHYHFFHDLYPILIKYFQQKYELYQKQMDYIDSIDNMNNINNNNNNNINMTMNQNKKKHQTNVTFKNDSHFLIDNIEHSTKTKKFNHDQQQQYTKNNQKLKNKNSVSTSSPNIIHESHFIENNNKPSSLSGRTARTTQIKRTNYVDENSVTELDSNSNQNTSTTSSYISDDCKVLYIETVIEVSKPVFYERLNSISNSEIHRVHTTDTTFTNSQNVPEVKVESDSSPSKRTINYSHFGHRNMSDNSNSRNNTVNDDDDVECILINPVKDSLLNTPLLSTPTKTRTSTSDHTTDSGYEQSANSTIQTTPKSLFRNQLNQYVNKDEQDWNHRSSNNEPTRRNQMRLQQNNDDQEWLQTNTAPPPTARPKPPKTQQNDENGWSINNRRAYMSQSQPKIYLNKSEQELWFSNNDPSTRTQLKIQRSPEEQKNFFPFSTDNNRQSKSQNISSSLTLRQRKHQIKNQVLSSINNRPIISRTVRPVPPSYIDRLRQQWLKSLILGLLILLALFTLYFYNLDSCTRNSWRRNVIRKIIRVEHDGLPTM
ncbi:unnamed protein product, partial [Didymodactylos carnosus]